VRQYITIYGLQEFLLLGLGVVSAQFSTVFMSH